MQLEFRVLSFEENHSNSSMAFTGNEDNIIPFSEGAVLTKKFRNESKPTDIIANYYSKDSIQALLEQSGCVGIRAYFGKNADDQLCLVIVGVDAEENDLIGEDFVCVDNGISCPNNCSTHNILNS
ncbi:MAG: hypothetical protein IPN88_04435 [Bacteroidetes bacterium]|nr:hypothetical protein [Bacteroidota bacterium]